MYKRRDWMHLHGENGGASDSSADDSSDDKAAVDAMIGTAGQEPDREGVSSDGGSGESSSSNSEQQNGSHSGSQEAASDSDMDPSAFRKLEDISEDDFEETEFNAELEELKRSWLHDAPATSAAAKPGSEVSGSEAASGSESDSANEARDPAGQEAQQGRKRPRSRLHRALKCRVCDGKLLLNPLMLRQHVASKKHVKRCQGSDPEDPICFATSIGRKEDGETHQERSFRVAAEKRQRERAAEAAQAAARPKAKQHAARKRGRHQETAKTLTMADSQLARQVSSPQQQRERPFRKAGKAGKRQRLVAKQELLAAGKFNGSKHADGRKPDIKRFGLLKKPSKSMDNRAARRAAKQAAYAAKT